MIQTSWLCAVLVVAAHTITCSQAPDQTVAQVDRPLHSLFGSIFHSIFLLLDHSAILGDCASQVLFAYLSIHLLHFEALLDSRALSNGLHKALPSANAASSVVSAATAAADASANIISFNPPLRGTMAEASAASLADSSKPASPPQLADVSWEELDKPKFYALGMTSFLGLRALLYPTFLIKTRMQTSTGLYTGTLDAVQKIVRTEGIKGIYRGFWVSSLSIVPRQQPVARASNTSSRSSPQALNGISVYELLRKELGPDSTLYNTLGAKQGEIVRNMIAGGGASMVMQVATVPLDVIGQRMMVSGLKAGPPPSAIAMVKEVYANGGVRGFYRGFVAAIVQFAPTSALWWSAYGVYKAFCSTESSMHSSSAYATLLPSALASRTSSAACVGQRLCCDSTALFVALSCYTGVYMLLVLAVTVASTLQTCFLTLMRSSVRVGTTRTSNYCTDRSMYAGSAVKAISTHASGNGRSLTVEACSDNYLFARTASASCKLQLAAHCRSMYDQLPISCSLHHCVLSARVCAEHRAAVICAKATASQSLLTVLLVSARAVVAFFNAMYSIGVVAWASSVRCTVCYCHFSVLQASVL
eukprot:16259-Heterococcus_DN1.PRE.2